MRTRDLFFGIGSFCIIAMAWVCSDAPESDAQQPTPKPAEVVRPLTTVYETDVKPLLQKYCYQCHGNGKSKGSVRLDKLSIDFVKGPDADLETWHDVLENMHRGEMPPKNQPRPSVKEHGIIVDWLNRAFVDARAQRESTSGKGAMRRLTSYEFQNTLEDLLGLKLNYSKDLLAEVPSRDGFLNSSSVLTTSSQHMRDFWSAARYAMSKAIVTGPEPKVHRHSATSFAKFGGKGKAKAGKKGAKAESDEFRNVLLPDTALMMPITSLPKEGPFRIRLKVQATGPRTSLLAWFKISANNQTSLIFAKPEVDPSPNSQVVEIFGNIEEIPVLAERAAKDGGIVPQLCISNVGNIHFFRGGNGSIYPAGYNPDKAKELLTGNPKNRDGIPIVRIQSIEFEAPYRETWPPAHHTRIFFASPNVKNESVYAREVIAAFMERAYRRPPAKDEIDRFFTLHEKLRPKFGSLEETMRETLALVLVSPRFIHLVEPRDPKQPRTAVTDYEWASRLSYFLWNSMPDTELLALAKQGKLKDAGTRQAQVERLLRDARSQRFIETITDQWWRLSSLDKVAVNPEFHPDFDNDLKADMRRESQMFFAEFVKSDLSMLRMIDADFTYLNNRLADHYGILHGPGKKLQIGSAFQRVALSPEHKRGGGILTHGSMLVLNSDGVESHPIKRAVWLRNAIFDDPPPEPPADVPELNTENRGKGGALTLKQRIEQHRTNPTCYHCHSRVDPWGIPFEQYDALGRYRSKYTPLAVTAAPKDDTKKAAKKAKNKKSGPAIKVTTPVDAKAELPDGRTVNGVEDLKQYILTHGKERYARAIVRKTLAYALGRSVERSDQPLVERLTHEFMAADFRYRALIVAIAQSEAFTMK